MRDSILRQHNELPGAKKVLFAPINTGEIETYDALIKCGFETYSMNYEGKFNKAKYAKVRQKIEQEFVQACEEISPDWVYMRVHHDIFTPSVVIKAREKSPKTLFSNWTGDVRIPPRPHFLEMGKVVDVSLIVSTGHIDLYKNHGLSDVRFVQAGALVNRFYVKSDEERAKLNSQKGHDIVFCANNASGFPGHKLRVEVAEKLSKIYGAKFAIYGKGWKKLGKSSRGFSEYNEQNNIYNASKIAISINNFNDVEMYFSRRQLIAMACGTLTVSKYIPGLERYFENGKDLVWFSTADECVDLVKYYMEHESEARKIGLSGAQKIIENHSQYSFTKNMAETLGIL